MTFSYSSGKPRLSNKWEMKIHDITGVWWVGGCLRACLPACLPVFSWSYIQYYTCLWIVHRLPLSVSSNVYWYVNSGHLCFGKQILYSITMYFSLLWQSEWMTTSLNISTVTWHYLVAIFVSNWTRSCCLFRFVKYVYLFFKDNFSMFVCESIISASIYLPMTSD